MMPRNISKNIGPKAKKYVLKIVNKRFLVLFDNIIEVVKYQVTALKVDAH
jgi:hypothetical protein